MLSLDKSRSKLEIEIKGILFILMLNIEVFTISSRFRLETCDENETVVLDMSSMT